jgi:hypothetical protein
MLYAQNICFIQVPTSFETTDSEKDIQNCYAMSSFPYYSLFAETTVPAELRYAEPEIDGFFYSKAWPYTTANDANTFDALRPGN